MTESPVIPASIVHLDFDTHTETEEKPDTPKLCRFCLRHPYDNNEFVECGRTATVSVSYKKPCGHRMSTLYCDLCWGAIEDGRVPTLVCKGKTDGIVCNKVYAAKPAIIRWERL